MNAKAKAQMILAVLALVALVATCGTLGTLFNTTARSYSPEGQAKATIMLRVTVRPTPVPRATQNPTVIAEWDQAQIKAARSFEKAVAAIVFSLCSLAIVACVSWALRLVSGAVRHAKATAMLMPMGALPKGSHIQLPGVVYARRNDRVTPVDEGAQAGENEIAQIEAQAGVDKLTAIATALQPRKPTHAERAQARYRLTGGREDD